MINEANARNHMHGHDQMVIRQLSSAEMSKVEESNKNNINVSPCNDTVTRGCLVCSQLENLEKKSGRETVKVG
jgi:hypothetical protein